jgi:hypothetical protein
MMSENGLSSKRIGLGVLAVALWVGTTVLSFLEIRTVREILLRVYAHFAATYGFYGRDYWGGQAVSIAALFAMAIVCIGVIIGCGEYHLKHFGDPKSWRLFGWTISAELSIFVLALFV